jgi:outer membrane putative beta-barrel porin/alpha-amylase
MSVFVRVSAIRALAAAVALLPTAWAASALASCGSAACLVNTQWQIHGIPTEAGGTLFQLQYDYIKQDTLMAGSHRTSVAPEDADALEQKTIAQTLTASLDYTFDRDWGVTVLLPLVARKHDHLADPYGEEPTPESWNYTRLGDLRAVGRYRFLATPSVNAGVQFGLVLPTGVTDVANSEGVVAERSLQPGTGATSGVAGLYANYADASGSLWFAQLQFQGAMATKDDYRPGNQVLLTGGVSYPVTDSLALLGQLNALWRARDSGANAEPEDSGGRSLFISPGISYTVSPSVQLYAFAQLPLYRYVNGTQLAVNWAAVGGVTFRF